MSIERTLTDVPDSEVNQVVSDFVSEGCSVVKEKQANGKWTVRATCPEKN
jgi:hypothetical protein